MRDKKFEFHIDSGTGDLHVQMWDVFVRVTTDKEHDPGGMVTITGECPRCEHWTFSANSCAREKNLMYFALPAFLDKLRKSNVEECEACKTIISTWSEQLQRM